MKTENLSLGSKLRCIRNMRNLSLRDVESKTGISNAYLSQLENGKVREPSPHFLYKLSKLYNVDYEIIMEYAGYVKPREKSKGPKTLTGAALFTTEDLTPEEEEGLAKYLQFLRSQK